MKKLLLFAFVAASVSANAQFTVWEDDFNDGEITDWTVWDLNADGQSWQANKDLQLDGNGFPDITTGQHSVLASYGIDMDSGSPLGNGQGYPFAHEWIKSPAIDLSFFAGTIELVINAQPSIYDVGNYNLIYVYASTSPEIGSFTLVGTVTLVRETIEDAEFTDHTVDLSEYVGEEQVYLAFVTIDNFFIGYEIDNVKITAEEIAGTKDQIRIPSKINQNPVNDMLQLQLGTSVTAENVKLQIYNVTGMLVKETAYNEAGVSVSDLAVGMYLLQLSDGASTERLKFIKK